ncbi:hypothetical protein CUC08_Gglean013087 [Alternaria sp. MG1]|nr:hypothetical protein CUC08_Gglean013087 [Alternaria sp. MG1]
MAPYRRQKRGFGWQYDNYPAFDIAANFGGVGGYGWNSSFDTQYYDLPGTVEQATRSHVEAQNEFEKAKEKYEEAKKKYEECEKKGLRSIVLKLGDMDASASIYQVAAGSTNASVGEDGPIGV